MYRIIIYMALLIVFLLLLPSCATVVQDETKSEAIHRNLEDQAYRHAFLINVNTCFVGYNTCTLKKFTKSKCWKDHERCVIYANKQFKHIQQQAKWRREDVK